VLGATGIGPKSAPILRGRGRTSGYLDIDYALSHLKPVRCNKLSSAILDSFCATGGTRSDRSEMSLKTGPDQCGLKLWAA